MSSKPTKKVKLEDIEIDERVYYRPQKDGDNIRTLVQKLEAGIELDPIKVQKVIEDDEKKIIILDGGHRLEAYKEYNRTNDGSIEEVNVEFWKDGWVDLDENMDEMLIHAHQSNDTQGLHNRVRDTRSAARKLKSRNPSLKGVEIAKELSRDQSTINQYIKDIRLNQEASERQLIHNLKQMGWSQQKIADYFEVTIGRRQVGNIGNNLDIPKISNLYRKGKSIEKIAELFDLSIPATWHYILKSEGDIDRFKKFGKSEHGDNEPEKVDKWEFPHPDPRIGSSYPGELWGQVVLNILYYHSGQGNLLIDPFAGGGSSIDACLIMGRECRAYDIKPSRGDILQNDIRDGYPREAKGADIILLDPPYGDKMVDEYGANGFTESRETIIENIEKLAKDSYETLSSQGRVALIYGNHKGQKDGGDIWAPDLYQFFRDVGFETEFIYHVPSKGHPSPTGQIQQRSRDLYIFKK